MLDQVFKPPDDFPLPEAVNTVDGDLLQPLEPGY
jgi:hypothetical protein